MDLERALRRHEDVWREEGYDSPAPKKPRDFRADNVHQGRKWGHPEVNCWTGMIYERCQAKGHPVRVSTRTPCAECGGFHGGISCEQWDDFQSVMTLAKQGNASKLPTQFRSLLQTKDQASGAQQLNQ
ncbi:hypothetical protein PHMEG_00033021 [Phytophthora megakarya]|uniref:Uncharacterized protein n=1 Tax=Phytophthora megakarya TaxID=4795 RepID=A0A225UWR3_9STRA|nr:hypothetical protein PHMEG_00033021 [Phytophthora megakarya]